MATLGMVGKACGCEESIENSNIRVEPCRIHHTKRKDLTTSKFGHLLGSLMLHEEIK